MSTAEIINRMQELPPEEIDLIWQAADRLRGDLTLRASPELLAAIEEAELSPELLAAIEEAELSLEREGGVPIEEVMKRFAT